MSSGEVSLIVISFFYAISIFFPLMTFVRISLRYKFVEREKQQVLKVIILHGCNKIKTISRPEPNLNYRIQITLYSIRIKT